MNQNHGLFDLLLVLQKIQVNKTYLLVVSFDTHLPTDELGWFIPILQPRWAMLNHCSPMSYYLNKNKQRIKNKEIQCNKLLFDFE